MVSEGAVQLLPYQVTWLRDRSRFKVGMFARQTGKTFAVTLEAVDDCLEAEAGGNHTHWVILSRGERQAREAMQQVKRHLEVYRAGFEALEVPFNPDINALEVRLPHGSRITAIPANPDTARGFSANVILDEFAFHKDSHEIWRALFPVISAGFKLRVVSTPNGKGNKFYELMEDRDLADTWSRHRVDIYEAVAQGLDRDIEELKRGINDPDGWAQEFELQWLDEASAWLSFDLINTCEDESAGIPERYEGGFCYVGWDVAARGDYSIMWVIEALGDVLWTRERVELRRASFGSQDAEFDRLMSEYRVSRAAIDQTGMGEKVVYDAQRRNGDSRVFGVLFNQGTKLEMATALKESLEDRRLRLPAGDTMLRADLHSVQRVAGPTGIPRLVAERTPDSGGAHADRFWALALAVTASAGQAFEYGYTPVPMRGKAARERTRPVRITGGFRGRVL